MKKLFIVAVALVSTLVLNAQPKVYMTKEISPIVSMALISRSTPRR